MAHLRFYFDFVCPYAYLASLEIERLCADAGATLTFHPMLLGGVFRSIGAPDVPRMPAPKSALNDREIERWAILRGATLKRPEAHPRRTVLALRATLAVEAPADRVRAAHALFAAYWRDGRDVEDPRVVAAALDEAGLDGAALVSASGETAAKEALRRETDDAVREGVFGAPAFLVEANGTKELLWGQDRMAFVHRALREKKPLEFYFDFSSPYAYLASTQVRGLAARAGSPLMLRPVLLGALFKSLGTANVPLFDMSPSKQKYNGEELTRFASFHGVPFKFTTHFPTNTVKALRLVLIAPEAARHDLIDALFKALWVENRDISTDPVLLEVLAQLGHDSGWLARTNEDAVKLALREANDAALARGVFGVPTFVVGQELFWGQDRLRQVERELIGNYAMNQP